MWEVKSSKEARKALSIFDNVIQKQVLAGIKKVSKNPLPNPNGYGKPLGNKGGCNDSHLPSAFRTYEWIYFTVSMINYRNHL